MASKHKEPDATWSMARLRNYECGRCGQRLDRMKRRKEFCSAAYGEREDCQWHKRLNAQPESEPGNLS